MACDVTNSVNDLWFRLGFASAGDMTASGNWVTVAELYQFADDAAQRLARISSVYVTYDASIGIGSGTAIYNLPAQHVFTVTAWLVYSGAPLQFLRISSVGQLFGLDGLWSATTGPPTRVSLDAGGVGTADSLSDSHRQFHSESDPAAISGHRNLRNVSSPAFARAAGLFHRRCPRGRARKESDSAMRDVADHLKQRLALYETVIRHLWGDGQTVE